MQSKGTPYRSWRLLLGALLLVALPAYAQDAPDAPDARENTTEKSAQTNTPPASPPVAQPESSPPTADTPPPTTPPVDYRPSEAISEDNSVSFPIDI
jgi:hypothetical protein